MCCSKISYNILMLLMFYNYYEERKSRQEMDCIAWIWMKSLTIEKINKITKPTKNCFATSSCFAMKVFAIGAFVLD